MAQSGLYGGFGSHKADCMFGTIARVAAGVALLALGACARPPEGDYPSFALRPVEEQASVVPADPVVAPPPPMVTATVAEAIRGPASDADRGESAFRSTLAQLRGQVLAGRGAAVGSEAWAAAQLALSRIATAREPTLVALGELDHLIITQSEAGDDGAVDALTAEDARVAALAEAQRRDIVALAALLSG